MDAMATIRQTFFQECDEQLIELESGLLSIQNGAHDSETINAVFRAVHSIKGGAGAFDLADLVHFAHVFENTLDLVRTDRLEPHPALIKIMLRAADVLADFVSAGRDGRELESTRGEDILEELAEQSAGSIADSDDGEPSVVFEPIPIAFDNLDDLFSVTPQTNRYTIKFAPRSELYARGNDTVILFRELSHLGDMTVTCDAKDLPTLDVVDPEGAYLSWTIELEGACTQEAIAEIFEFVEWDSGLSIEHVSVPGAAAAAPLDYSMDVAEGAFDEPEPLQAKETVHPEHKAAPEKAPSEKTQPDAERSPDGKGGAAAATTIRVDLDRVDRLIDLVGELVINQAMLTERAADLALPRTSPVSIGLDELEQLTREIQDSVMAIRAQSVKSVFQRLPRLVREVAAQTGKSVRLETEGEQTEVDKTVIERLIDPLTHMIRNAIDHGLEKPDVRQGAGKSSEGVLRVSAAHRSGRIVIEVTDDGAGINRERVRSIAVAKGLIAEEAKLSDEEVDNLIFLPGFSTAETISDISGRGVGMDVVRRSIQALGGRISIASSPGRGSTFTMSLPLTLAVLDGMVVTVADQTLVLPLSTIVEILMPQTMAVHDFGEQTKVIGLRNAFIPLVDIGRRLRYRDEAVDPKRSVVLLVEADGGARNALVVDAIQGQRQVVIKSLEANYGSVSGIAAATILGNGRVALILDVDAVVADTSTERSGSNFLLAG